MKRPRLLVVALALIGVAALAAMLWMRPAAEATNGPSQAGERRELGLMTSLPIFWSEDADIAALASGSSGEAPWVRGVLEQNFDLVPLDTLSQDVEAGPEAETDIAPSETLSGLDYLIVAQPRGFTPADNVALDQWVREGGQVLYVLDPMLTGHYAVPIMDPRHPPTVGLIPPLVGRWGLEMIYDERQPLAVRPVESAGVTLPVALAGQFRVTGEGIGDCRIEGDAVLAVCRVGEGRAVMLADAALFELEAPGTDAAAQLAALLALAFD